MLKEQGREGEQKKKNNGGGRKSSPRGAVNKKGEKW